MPVSHYLDSIIPIISIHPPIDIAMAAPKMTMALASLLLSGAFAHDTQCEYIIFPSNTILEPPLNND